DHLQPGGQQGEGEERAGGVPVRPEPAQIVAQIRPPLPAIEGLRCPRRLIVESPLGVVLNKRAIALTRRARRLGHFRLEGVPDRARRLGPSCAPAPAGGYRGRSTAAVTVWGIAMVA